MATTGLAATSIDAVARHSNVSKMTIYKWWPSREALLIDAFLNHASLMLPLPTSGTPAERLRRHAAAYAKALLGRVRQGTARGDLRVHLEHGVCGDFLRALSQLSKNRAGRIDRRRPAGQSIGAAGAPEDLYDAIYGSLFYRYIFGIKPISPAQARNLVDTLLMIRSR